MKKERECVGEEEEEKKSPGRPRWKRKNSVLFVVWLPENMGKAACTVWRRRRRRRKKKKGPCLKRANRDQLAGWMAARVLPVPCVRRLKTD